MYIQITAMIWTKHS